MIYLKEFKDLDTLNEYFNELKTEGRYKIISMFFDAKEHVHRVYFFLKQ